MADGLIASLGQQIKGEDAEREFINTVAAAFNKKPETQRRVMNPQMGWSGKEVIDFWGPPGQVIEMGSGVRVFVYRRERDERSTTATVHVPSGQVVATETYGKLRQCELSLTMRPGGKVPGAPSGGLHDGGREQ